MNNPAPSYPPEVHLVTLGTPALVGHGAPIQLRKKDLALLVYLRLEGKHGHSRGALAGLLWANSREENARHSLTQAIGRLRARLDGVLEVGHDRVGCRATLPCDAAALQQAAAAPRVDDEVLALCGGEFLAGFYPGPGAEAFETWADGRRAHLRTVAVTALDRLGADAEERGAWETALAAAQRATELDPASEPAHRRVMRAWNAQGHRVRALQHYDRLAAWLAAEFETDPEPETALLAEQLRARATPPPAPRAEPEPQPEPVAPCPRHAEPEPAASCAVCQEPESATLCPRHAEPEPAAVCSACQEPEAVAPCPRHAEPEPAALCSRHSEPEPAAVCSACQEPEAVVPCLRHAEPEPATLCSRHAEPEPATPCPACQEPEAVVPCPRPAEPEPAALCSRHAEPEPVAVCSACQEPEVATCPVCQEPESATLCSPHAEPEPVAVCSACQEPEVATCPVCQEPESATLCSACEEPEVIACPMCQEPQLVAPRRPRPPPRMEPPVVRHAPSPPRGRVHWAWGGVAGVAVLLAVLWSSGALLGLGGAQEFDGGKTPPALHPPLAPAGSPVAWLGDWLRTDGRWIYYRYELWMPRACDHPTRAVGNWGPDGWTVGNAVHCIDDAWLAVDVERLGERFSIVPETTYCLNFLYLTGSTSHYGQHGLQGAPGLDAIHVVAPDGSYNIGFAVVREGPGKRRVQLTNAYPGPRC